MNNASRSLFLATSILLSGCQTPPINSNVNQTIQEIKIGTEQILSLDLNRNFVDIRRSNINTPLGIGESVIVTTKNFTLKIFDSKINSFSHRIDNNILICSWENLSGERQTRIIKL